MRLVQRLSALAGWATIATVGTLLILEAVGAIDDGWRVSVADFLEDLGAPALERWAAALIGVALGVVAVVIAAAQFVPYQRTRRFGIVVDRRDDGELAVQSRAIGAAIDHLLGQVDGVIEATAIVDRRKLVARVGLTDDANVTDVDRAARERIDAELWAALGLAPRRIDLVYEYQRAPARIAN